MKKFAYSVLAILSMLMVLSCSDSKEIRTVERLGDGTYEDTRSGMTMEITEGQNVTLTVPLYIESPLDIPVKLVISGTISVPEGSKTFKLENPYSITEYKLMEFKDFKLADSSGLASSEEVKSYLKNLEGTYYVSPIGQYSIEKDKNGNDKIGFPVNSTFKLKSETPTDLNCIVWKRTK